MPRSAFTIFVMAIIMFAASAAAGAPPVPVGRGVLPSATYSALAASFSCIGGLIDRSPSNPVLLVVRGPDDGSSAGNLNDRGYLVLEVALSRFQTRKLLSTSEPDEALPAIEAATEARYGPRTTYVLSASFNAFDARTYDVSKSKDVFLFALQASSAKDRSFSAIHLATQLKDRDRVNLPGGGSLFKAMLENRAGRTSISIFGNNADIGATWAKAQFQGVGDVEETLVEVAALDVVQRVFRIDPSECLNRPDGPDLHERSAAAFDTGKLQAHEDAAAAALFQLGYLAEPVIGASPLVTPALRRFEARTGLPADGRVDETAYIGLQRAVARGEKVAEPDFVAVELGKILEAGDTGRAYGWDRGHARGQVQISRTWPRHQAHGRPCRQFTHNLTVRSERYVLENGLACRIAPEVWAITPN